MAESGIGVEKEQEDLGGRGDKQEALDAEDGFLDCLRFGKKKKNKDASRDEEEPDGKSVQESNQKTPANFYKEEREAPSTSQIKTDEHKYDLSHKKLGTAFVFVNEVFDSPNFMDRLGAKDDLRYYNEAFTHLGFKVKEYLDKTAEQIEKDISTCYLSFRRKTGIGAGSWFVTKLWEVIKEHGFQLELMEMMTLVNQKVTQEYPYHSKFEFEKRRIEKIDKLRDNVHFQKFKPAKKLGKAFVFVNRDFDDGKSYPYRRGAENDEQHYQEAFENLGFKVVKHFDKTAKQIQDIISQYGKEDHTNESCLVLAFSSHENRDMANPGNDIIMAKDKPIDMGFIIKQLSQEKSPTLDGKPKLIFVQACRGFDMDIIPNLKTEDYEKIIPRWQAKDASLESLPLEDGFYMAYARPASYYSFRREKKGSFFVSVLQSVLKLKYKFPNDLEKLMAEVELMLSNNDRFLGQRRIVPQFASALLKSVHFHRP